MVICIIVGLHPPFSEAARKKPKPAPAKLQPSSPASPPATLSEPPPIEQLRARLAWADREADALRAVVLASPKDEGARVLLASLAVVAASDLERALSVGDVDTATGLRRLIERKLADTRWRLGLIGRQGAGGGFFALGVLSLHGILGERDAQIACSLFSSAWDKGFLDAAYRLSDCVGSQDPARAASLLETAADSGHSLAAEQLGRRCLEANPKDLKCAFSRISMAAETRASAKSLLGWMYAGGLGVDADPARALALYQEAAQSGDLSARNNLGEVYETGRGLPRDVAKAADYYRAAAEAGFAPAQFNLGRLYAGGVGVEKDADKARTWLQSALRGGIQPAQQLLDWLDQSSGPKR